MSELLESATVQHLVPFIREEGNSKSLHFSVNLLQSRMHHSRPDELDIDVLTDQGVMAVNLHDTHPLYELFIDRIGRSFDHNIAEVYGNRDGNVIVFAGHKITISPHSFRNNIQCSRAPWKDGQALNA